MERLARVCNRYPIVEIRCSTEKATPKNPIGSYALGEKIDLTATIVREEEDANAEALSVFNTPVFA